MKAKKNKYNVDHFIEKFEAIPANQWAKGAFTTRSGKSCAMGFCGKSFAWNKASILIETDESAALRQLVFGYTGISIYRLNDGFPEANRLFPNKTIKGRVLAALRVIKLMQEAGLDPVAEEAHNVK